MNPQETRRQQFDHLKKNTLMALTTALRAPLMLLFGCGYVHVDGKLKHLHDHGGQKLVTLGYLRKELYDPEQHGEIIEFINEGERVPGLKNSTDDRQPIHRHYRIGFGSDGSSGPYEYHYE